MRELIEHYNPDWTKDSIRIHNTPSPTARMSYFYIQECGHFKTASSYYTERENLDSYLVIFTLKGRGELYCQGKNYRLTEKTLCFINCREYHRYACLEDWEFLWFHFHGVAARGYYETFAATGNPVVTVGEIMGNQMQRILALTKNRQRDSELIVSLVITQILTEGIIAGRHTDSDLIFMPQYIKEILRYIDRNYMKNLSVAAIARSVGFSGGHFSREFKKYTGMCVREYIVVRRMDAAKEYLKYTDDTVGEIADKIGMSSASRFIALFRQKESMTPLKYRKKWHRSAEENWLVKSDKR